MPVDWTEIIKLIGGPLAGGAIALSGIWIKELFDRHKATQNWFEEKYIAEGLDRFYAYVMTIQYSLMVGEDHPALEIQAQSLPVEAVNRLQIVLKTEVFTLSGPLLLMGAKSHKSAWGDICDLIAKVDEASRNLLEGERHDASHVLRRMHEELLAQKAALKANLDIYVSVSNDLRYDLELIREEMLKAKIRKKSDIYKLAKSRRIQSLLDNTQENLSKIGEASNRLREASASLKCWSLNAPEGVTQTIDRVATSSQS